MPRAADAAEASKFESGRRVGRDAAVQSPYTVIEGWSDEAHADVLGLFARSGGRSSCPFLRDLSARAATVAEADARTFIETHFTPQARNTEEHALLTGYYEPELPAATERSDAFAWPIHRAPPDLPATHPWKTRAEIDAGALDGMGLEIAWLRSPLDVFFLHVQGSGRLVFDDGHVLRVGYGGRNNHPYRSIGAELIRRDEIPPSEMSAQAIRRWADGQPDGGRAFLRHNPSYVFFRPRPDLDATQGPIGTLGVPLTTHRSLAVDPAHIPLGGLVWVSAGGINRLCLAHDTGSAIIGRDRADLFCGTGDAAGEVAGRLRARARIVPFVANGRSG